jgi:hypothetical protein
MKFKLFILAIIALAAFTVLAAVPTRAEAIDCRGVSNEQCNAYYYNFVPDCGSYGGNAGCINPYYDNHYEIFALIVSLAISLLVAVALSLIYAKINKTKNYGYKIPIISALIIGLISYISIDLMFNLLLNSWELQIISPITWVVMLLTFISLSLLGALIPWLISKNKISYLQSIILALMVNIPVFIAVLIFINLAVSFIKLPYFPVL